MSENEHVFERETAMCRKLHKEKGGCAWGKCDSCGVIPLLHKLFKGEIIEDETQVNKAKRDIFGAQ